MNQVLFKADLVIAARAGHPFARAPTLERYYATPHLVVSITGDPHGYVDDALAARNLSRRVALTVSNFIMALAVIAETDVIAALPRAFISMHGRRFGIVGVEPPIPLRRFDLHIIAPRAAMMDAGLAWLFSLLARLQPGPRRGRAAP